MLGELFLLIYPKNQNNVYTKIQKTWTVKFDTPNGQQSAKFGTFECAKFLGQKVTEFEIHLLKNPQDVLLNSQTHYDK